MASGTNEGSIVYQVELESQALLVGQRKINANLDEMEGRFLATGKSVGVAEKSFLSLSRVAASLTAALSVQQVAQYANAWVDVSNKLVNAVRPSEQLADVTQRVFDISQNTRSGIEATAALYGRLERATRSVGTSTADLAKLTSTINKGLVVSGASTAEASSTMIQLSQALASGVLRGEEFNSISENGSRLAVALADSLGVTQGELRAMAAQGKLTTDVVVKGLLTQGDAIAKEFGNTILTMGQAFTVAENNITKFVGSSTTVKSAVSVFNDSIISISENIDVMSNAIIGAGLIFGGRYAGALALSAKATVGDTIAKIQNAKETEASTAAELRRAQAAKAAAIVELDKAQSRAAGARVAASATAAEVTLAEAEATSIRTNMAQIEAEKALEAQRLKAQITDQGRIATTTRMAQLQQASSALNVRLTQAEAAADKARATAYVTNSGAIAVADATVSKARIALADATGMAHATNIRYEASARAASIASTVATIAVNGLKSAMALLGGPIGIVAAVAAGWYLYAQQQSQARKESVAFANTLPDVISKLKEMNLAQAQGVRADTIESIKNQKKEIDDLKDRISSLTDEYNKYNGLAKQFGVTNDENNGYVIKAAEAANELAKANRDLDSKTKTLTDSQDALSKINIQVNQGILDQMRAARDNALALAEAERKTTTLSGAQSFLAEKLGVSTTAMQKFNAESLKINWGGNEGEKLIKQAERRLTLSKLEGKAKAEQQAAFDAEDAGVTDPAAINALRSVYAQTEANTQAKKNSKKATSEQESADKKAATQAENVAQKLANLKQQSEMAAESTNELSRAQTILNAQQSLGSGATQAQITQAGVYAAKKWDAANAIKAQAAAEKLLPEARENASYTQDVKDLNTALAAKKISQEQYNATSERLEQQHQATLAQIRAGQVVTAQQDSAGSVDPVQALANENAKKMELIKQFEADGTLTHQQAIALRAGADRQYETDRVNAQWALFTQQSIGYEALGAAVDSFGQGASSALSSVITGTQSASDAMRGLADTVLSSVIQTFVEMGLQQAKSAIMGASVQQSAIAATTATQVGALGTTTAASVTSAGTTMAAWLPAALVASVGSFGAAAIIGGAALVGAFALSKTLSGKRKNGGPVSAGSMYQVGEGGMPEIYQASNGSQYMIPGDNGKVISNKDIQGGSPNITLIVQNMSSGAGVQDYQVSQGSDGGSVIQLAIADIQAGGPLSGAISKYHQAPRRATE
ncbi:tape measure protein [Serratia liquefaciens]|uniref:tape measure protein n=1 Tax=Serratia liquefaciens TaxID=614 RepID=UPI000DFE570B|nr:tape measure protein [Serratia liquefaciens]SUI70550.1 Phage-related minor tail protein [Serratia liquefaciens]